MLKVVIELEFEKTEDRLSDLLSYPNDVYDYLYELMDDGSLDYTVYDGDNVNNVFVVRKAYRP